MLIFCHKISYFTVQSLACEYLDNFLLLINRLSFQKTSIIIPYSVTLLQYGYNLNFLYIVPKCISRAQIFTLAYFPLTPLPLPAECKHLLKC